MLGTTDAYYHCLTILARIDQRGSPARELIAEAFAGRVERLAEVAVKVVTETADPNQLNESTWQTLTDLLKEHEPSPSVALRLYSELSVPTVAWRELRVVVTRQLLRQELNRPTANPDRVGALHNDLSVGLSDLGQMEKALVAAEDAVPWLRQHVEVHPEAYDRLALALANLSKQRLTLRQFVSAVEAIDEAVRLFPPEPELPQGKRVALALCLVSQSEVRRALGNREGALSPAAEARKLFRSLAGKSLERYGVYLAGTLENLAVLHGELGQHEQACATALDAVSLLRKLVLRSPDRYKTTLATALNILSNSLSTAPRKYGDVYYGYPRPAREQGCPERAHTSSSSLLRSKTSLRP